MASEAIVPVVPVQATVVSRNQFAKKPIIAELRRQLMERPEDLAAMISALITQAKNGFLPALQLIMERLEGKAIQQLIIDDERESYNFAMEVHFNGKCPHCGKEL